MSQRRAITAIREVCPELAISSVEWNKEGQNSDVAIVNGDLVFRFPKYEHVLARFRTETAILRGIQGRVTLPVPNPVWTALDRPVGEALVGYRMIPGRPLWRETFARIKGPAAVRQIAHQVASFLRSLHDVPVAEAIGVALPRQDTREQVADIYAQIRARLFDRMRMDARRWATAHWEGFLQDPANWDYRPVLKHGDFGPSNIIFDEAAGRVTGVIDFGNAGLGDPAYDFAGLLSGYGEGFLQVCPEVYPELAEFLDRVHFYRGTFALLEALFGIENDDQEALAAGLERYV